MFNSSGGMMVGDQLISDYSKVINDITKPTIPYVCALPEKPLRKSFNESEWSNEKLIKRAIGDIHASCSEFCVGDCDCSDVARLMEKRFLNV